MDTIQWIMAGMLGLSLAASTGLNTFLPLLMLASAAHFQVGGVTLNGHYAWLASDTALIVLGLATAFEVIGDKIPAVDHGLDTIGFVARPAAGALAAASVFTGVDPLVAAVAGLVMGAPASFGFHTAKAATRVTSSVGTFGCANPFLSVVEDMLAISLVLIGLFLPLLVPVFLVVAVVVLCKLIMKTRRAGTPPPPTPSD